MEKTMVILRQGALLLIFIAVPLDVSAGIQLSNALAKDIGKAYGFYMAQDHSLKEISKKYPSMSGLVLIADKEFLATFKSSVEGMDALMSEHGKREWEKIKNQLTVQIASSINIDQITESEARQFVDIVRQRAKGSIESPIIETLLLFKSGYEENPEFEFHDDYRYKYTANGTGKAKGIAFSIEVPKTWAAEEGKRPNVVQKFTSANGRGTEVLLVLVKDMPLRAGEIITEKDVAAMLSSSDINDLLVDGSEYINSGKLTLENLPGIWVQYSMNTLRLRTSIEMEVIMYAVFYKSKMIQIQGHVMTTVNGKQLDSGGLKKFEKLFDLVANSLVLPDLYK